MNATFTAKDLSSSIFALALRWFSGSAALALLPSFAPAAGILTPVGSHREPIRLESHSLRVVINNGFARSEVEQVFYNPNSLDLEAIYQAPVPERGALSELTIWAGDRILQGEVVAKEEADRIYREERSQGNEVAKADRDGYQDFEFAVYPVPAQGRARMRYVYYEPLTIESGVGRYAYRLEEGGADEASEAFWTLGDTVDATFDIEVVLKSAWPVARTRTPRFAGASETLEDGSLVYRYASQGARLDQDFVFYYMLEENLPGRVEMMTYREAGDAPGAFMMLLTPGEDLQPLAAGSDFAFVLDTSGSMQGKLHTLVAGIKKALGELRPEDRFRIIAFNTSATELGSGWRHATPENAQGTLDALDRLAASGSTNLYEGIRLALSKLDADRVSSVILVTDGVTNEGVVDPARFYKLLRDRDLRFFGFLLGNGANWPLMELLCEASCGSFRAVSNSDDIVGEILLAKNAVAYESLRDAKLTIDGVEVFDVSSFQIGKIHRGEQLALFGRYDAGGRATARLEARILGEAKIYETEIEFPGVDTRHPELERLWALDQTSKIEVARMAGWVDADEAKVAIRDIGVAYQIVTDETSMIALDDASFARRGLERRNLDRVAREAAARSDPRGAGARRADAAKPMFSKPAPSLGGGAVEPWMVCLFAAGALLWRSFRRPQARIARAASVALAIAALGASVSQADDFGTGAPRWTDRRLEVGPTNSSIDCSIANFWGVSEEAARASEAKVERPSEPFRNPRAETADTHRVVQTRDRDARSGHFGLNLFNIVPVFDFVWGDRSQSEADRYEGQVRR